MKKTLLLCSVLSIYSITGCQTIQTDSLAGSISDNNREINQVSWDKSGETFKKPGISLIAENQSQIVFFRPNESIDTETTKTFQDSVNIGINNKFHTSLQPGHYSQVVVCSGEQKLSLELTESKNNHLANSDFSISFQPKQLYYYVLDVNSLLNKVEIHQVNEDTAIQQIQSFPEQTHQLNRVTATDCTLQVPPEPEKESEPILENKPIKLEVLFDFDSANIRNKYHPKLKSVSEFMSQNLDFKTVLNGHTDSLGSDGYNLSLSKKRAEAVKNVLIKEYGVDEHRIQTFGYGESQPIDTNDTAEGRQNNRRVIAIIKNL